MGDDHEASVEKNSAGTDDAVRAQYEWATTPPLLAVVETIATAVGCETDDIDSVYESVDPDALDAIMRHSKGGPGEGIRVAFPYGDWTVSVHESGEVVVRRDHLETPARRSDAEDDSCSAD
jgi:hypothetical protein